VAYKPAVAAAAEAEDEGIEEKNNQIKFAKKKQ
jgi:hypothetical protein